VWINASTCAFTVLHARSASTTGVVSEGAAARLASSSTLTLLTGANVSATRQAKMPSREIVNHGMEIGAGPVEQADDGGVDVPHLVPRESCEALSSVSPDARGAGGGASRSAGRGGTQVEARPRPCRVAGEDGECAGRDVTIIGRGDHLLDRLDSGSVSRDGDVRDRRTDHQAQRALPPAPGIEPTGRHTEDRQHPLAMGETRGPDPRRAGRVLSPSVR